MKRFFIKSVACIALAFLLAGVLPFNSKLIYADTDTADVIFAPTYVENTGNSDLNQQGLEIINYEYKPVSRELSDKWIEIFAEKKGNNNENIIEALTKERYEIEARKHKIENKIYNIYRNLGYEGEERWETLKAAIDNGESAYIRSKGEESQQANDKIQKAQEATISAFEVEGGYIVKGMVSAFNWILFGINKTLAWLIGATGSLLDDSVEYTMTIANQKALISQVEYGWKLFRDAFNIFFIFILLYISIKQIIAGASANTKKMLSSVIVGALLINFSLMVTKVIIDTGNIFTSALYNQIITEDIPKYSKAKISNAVMSALEIQSIESSFFKDNDAGKGIPVASINLIMVQLVTITIYGLVLWAFLTVSVLLLTRIVMFFLLMALSPVAFVGSFIPKIGEYSKKWWDNLINQTLVGPVFMFLMLVTIRLIGPLSQFTLAGTITADRSSGINNSASVFGLILNTAIIVGFIIATVKITKKFSGEAGAFLSKAAGGLAGALTVGAGGMLLRNTIGRGAALLVNNEKVKNIATRMPGGGLALKGISNVSKASFDVRNTALGKTLDKQGLNLGKAGGADGFQGQVKRYSDMAVEKSKLMKIDTDSNSGNKIVNKILNEEVMPKAQKEAKLKEKIDTSNQTFEDNKKGIEVEIDAIKAEHKAASDALINETDPGKKANLQTQQTDAIARIKAKEKEISDNEKARKLKAEEVERLGLTKQEEKDSENIIIRGAKLEELRAKAKKDAESLNQNTYADNMKKAVLPHIIGGKKGARDLAAQIRKTAGGKSANDLVVEQMKKEQAEKDKAAAATNPTPSTP